MTSETGLARRLALRIRGEGPIGVDAFMAAALTDPEDGYYATRTPLGSTGDFVTAPEISQIFGEIIGAWCLDLWQRLGAPKPLRLVELGPGSGRLIADVLRVVALRPDVYREVELHLVEIGRPLRAAQAARLDRHHPGIGVSWHDTFDSVAPGPMILIANEFFDALPIRQWIAGHDGWHERRVGLDDRGGFRFVTATTPAPVPPAFAPPAAPGALFEDNPAALALAEAIGERLAAAPGAALLIDYGPRISACGETLQAVRRHARADPLEAPGSADLTAHVDFAALRARLNAAGAEVFGPVPQRLFLETNGAILRARLLARGKDEAEATAIAMALGRLIDPAQMGDLFKVMAAVSPGLAEPPGGFPASAG